MAMSDATEPKKLYQQLAKAVADRIRAGTYPRGRRLPSERELAEQFGVSRPTVREAMIALEIQGFVESRHGSGIYVSEAPAPPDPMADLDIGPFELTEARRVVEAEACALAAVSITDAEVAELNALLLDMAEEVAAPPANPAAHEKADRRFHVLVARATRNSALVNVVEALWDMRYRSPLCLELLARARRAGDLPRIDEHRVIVEALAARDPKAARQAMRDHLTRVIDGLLDATESEAVARAREETASRRDAYARRASV
jgi:GntR family transcriptional regulator, hexuronate regulon transcriptional repressor